MPFRTELAAVNDAARIDGVNDRLPTVLSRTAESISEGELTRVGIAVVPNVGGPDVRPTSESVGNTP
jgi:hypothetical protein